MKGFIEIFVALTVMNSFLTDSYTLFYCFFIYGLTSVRSIYKERFDIMASIFFLAYTMQNMIVNLVDFLIFRKALGFYNDLEF